MHSRFCKVCDQSYSRKYVTEWCQPCHSKFFQSKFRKWTSKNTEIDKFLQHVQYDANSYYKVAEWIPYNRLLEKKQIGKGGFGTIYSAYWLDGQILNWDIHNQNWNRNKVQSIVLKILKNSNSHTCNLLKEVSFQF